MGEIVAVLFGAALLVAALVFAAQRPARRIHTKQGAVQPSRIATIDVDALVRRSLSVGLETGYRQDHEDLAFESWISDHFGDQIDKHFYSRVAGVSYSNKDGSSRQAYVLACRPRQEVRLVPEPDNPYGATAVRVETLSGSQMGYLPRNVSAEHSGGIDRWLAVVRKVTPAVRDQPAGLVICLLRKVKEDNSEEGAFERWFEEEWKGRSDRRYFGKIQHYHGLNPDGSDRQTLITSCRRGDLLSLVCEPDDGKASNTVQVRNADNQLLGYLEPWKASFIAPEMNSGRVWKAIVFKQIETPAGRRKLLGLLIFRLSDERPPLHAPS